MPINSSILRSVRTPKLPNPVEQFTTGLQLRNLLLGNQAQEMEIESAQTKQAMESRIREIIGKHGGDLKKAAPEISAIDPSFGMAIAKYEQEFAKSQADMAQSQAATESSRATTRKTGEELAQARDKAKRGYFSDLPRIPEAGRFAVYQARRPSALRSEYFTPDELPEDEPRLRARFGDDWATALAGGPDVQLMQEQRLKEQADRPRTESYAPGALIIRHDAQGNEISREVVPQRRENTTFEEDTYSDFLKDVELIRKYGPTRIGFDKYRQDQRVQAAQAGRMGENPLSPYAESNIVNRLQTRWDSQSKARVELNRQLAAMDAGLEAARRGDLAQGAQALLVTFQKILDPLSVVRESEYARSSAGLSLLNRMQGYFERLAKGGGGVPLPELEKFVQVAREMAAGQTQHLASVKKQIEATAGRYKIPSELVTTDDLLTPKNERTGPQPGTVEDGYVFQGGDPSDPKNWKKQ